MVVMKSYLVGLDFARAVALYKYIYIYDECESRVGRLDWHVRYVCLLNVAGGCRGHPSRPNGWMGMSG